MEIKDWTSVSFDEGRAVLRQWREEHARRSEEIVELWEHVLSRYPSSLNDELWIVYEQVCIAALDCDRQDVATECIVALDKQFPNSNRVMKLQAMRFESIGKYKEALQLYEKFIAADPTSVSFRKRKIAIYKVKGERMDAIRELNEYLKVFLNDSEAWLELSQLYLREGDYSRAAHCVEELILADPFNALYLRRLADIRYTQGGSENVEHARSYFEQAAKLNTTCVRSLFGVIMSCNWLLPKTSGNRKKELVHSAEQAISQLEEIFNGPGNANEAVNRKVVESLRKTLQQFS
uniref:ER membrane protein complex subunit 2 n=1 Tax=Steinernema glaseri TaxID=37863 RepID=A0A1I7YEV3_9BILA